jgi:hypothetical protein
MPPTCPATFELTRACACAACREAYAPLPPRPNGPGTVYDRVVNQDLRPIVVGETIFWVPI